MPTKIEKDHISGTDTTGHVWDGIKELNTPLPKWWIYTFYATVVWALAYFVLYPAIPWFSGHTRGVLGYETRGEVRQAIAAAEAQRAPFMNRIRQASLEQVRRDQDLLNFALTGGRIAFAENCAPCHGAGGAGRVGYPNLADDVWIWGGTLAQIQQTIRYGIRSGHGQARASQMPRFGADGLLNAAQIQDTAEFVLSLSNRAQDQARVARGRALYAENCVSCHGDRGEGNAELGAPSLTTAAWIYGGDRAAIIETITNARAGVMPSWEGRLDPATIQMLTVYVHALGGGR